MGILKTAAAFILAAACVVSGAGFSASVPVNAGQKKTAGTETDILDTEVSFAELDIEPLLTVIREQKPVYPHADLFGTEEALARYDEMQEYEPAGKLQFIEKGKIKETALRKQVKENNAALLAAHSYGSRYTEMSDKDFNLVFSALVETLNNRMHVVDLQQLDDNLSRLTILNTTNSYMGAVTYEDIMMTVNLKACRNVNGEAKIISTVSHETSHLAGYCSIEEKEAEGYDLNTGMQYGWSDLKYNPLYNNWLIEASAEKLSQLDNPDRDKKKDMYREFVKTQDSMTLAVILDDAVEGITIPELNCQGDLNRLFELFDAETDGEKAEIINMLYGYNLVYDANSTNKNLPQAKDFYKEAGVEDREVYRREVCAASALTMAKSFYRTLAGKLKTAEDISLRDLFVMLVLEEADLNRVGVNMMNSSYEYGTKERTDRFVDGYTAIQEAFFELVSEDTGIPSKELYRAFDDFYKAYNYEFTVDTALLSEEEQAFVLDILDTRTAVKPYDNIFTFKK